MYDEEYNDEEIEIDDISIPSNDPNERKDEKIRNLEDKIKKLKEEVER